MYRLWSKKVSQTACQHFLHGIKSLKLLHISFVVPGVTSQQIFALLKHCTWARGCTSHYLKDLQRQAYQEEIKLPSKGAWRSSQSKLYQLDAFLDQDGILKVGGRLKNASLPTLQKHPVIIPNDHHITKIIISRNHEQARHQGEGLN